MIYATQVNPESPFTLPKSYEYDGSLIMGFDALTDSERANFGVYPFVREPLNEGAIGWGATYFDEATQAIIKPSLPADPEAALAQKRTEMSCSKLQAKLAISALGMIAEFMAWKSALDPVVDFEKIAYLEDAQTWKRDDPTFNAAADALGKSGAERDAFFELAVTL